jgi:hypothetical protein
MRENIIECTELVEIQVNPTTNTGNTISFTNTGSLSKIAQWPITGIEAYHVDIMPISPLSNLPLCTVTRLKKTFLNMYYAPNFSNLGAGEYITKHPLVSLINVDQGTNPFVFDRQVFDRQIMQWDKCEIFSPTVFSDEETAYAFVFNISYAVSTIAKTGIPTPGIMKQLIDNVNAINKRIGGR